MSAASPAPLPPERLGAGQPCAESCRAFRPLHPDRWSDYGRCVHPRAHFRGYPVRLGRVCRDYLPPGVQASAAG